MKDARSLLAKFKNGVCSEEETRLIAHWLLELDAGEESTLSIEDFGLAKQDIWKKIEANTVVEHKKARLWPKIAIAASIIVAFSTGLIFWLNSGKPTPDNILSQDIRPGKNIATLTLSSGKKIILSDTIRGEFAKEAGVVISKTSDGQLIYETKDHRLSGAEKMNTLSTSNGQTYRLRLPDGSLVWLNAASSIKYPASFISSKSRKVELDGEAYFEITKDKNHPFIVKTREQQVKVLGTHFNINSYRDDPRVKTTLLEGKVSVSNASSNRTRVLSPGDQSILTGPDLRVVQIDTAEAIAWKNGEFMFSDQPLGDIMKSLSRWYNVEVIYKDERLKEELFGGAVSRFDDISKVLKVLQLTGHVHFKVEGRRITVMK
jgi:transmembrane sensor